MATTERDRFRGCLLGLAIGDTVGSAVEFRPRGSFEPVTDMTGGGPFALEAGEWTDDTSMTLCLAESLLTQGRFDARDQMERYVRWYRDGHMSSIGKCFDIGITTSHALQRFEEEGDPLAGSSDAYSAGNGSIMRLAPVPMFFSADPGEAVRYAGESSLTTHGARNCVDACRLLALLLTRALAGKSKEEILFGDDGPALDLAEEVRPLAAGDYADKTEDQIRGTGYVIDTLEAAMWCFLRGRSFRASILMAVNLGDDTDTTAAVCGQIAGAFYGESGIPPGWREKLCMGKQIAEFADRLHTAGHASK